MGSPPAVEAKGLTRSFGATRAVAGVDLEVERGTVYAVLGPNGAGKTTTIRVLATLLRPDGGTARVFGRDVTREPQAVRDRLSLTGQFASVDDDLTGLENLVLLGRLRGFTRRESKARARELLGGFGLADAANRQVKRFSGGMRRRLDIAASLVVLPDLLFLDEPTTGLDPRSRNQVWDVVRRLRDHGTTVVLTTQYLEEADHLADRIALIDRGRVITEGTSSELKRSIGAPTLHVRVRDAQRLQDARDAVASALHERVDADIERAEISARLADPALATRALNELSSSGIAVRDFSLAEPSLDDVFLALTGERHEEDPTEKEEAA